jgi:hypothetical protein
MDQRHLPGEAPDRLGQGFSDGAEEEMPRVGNAVRMGHYFPLEDEDLAGGENLAQVIEGSPVAQTHLEDRPIHLGDQASAVVQASSLRFQAANETVEAAHLRCRRAEIRTAGLNRAPPPAPRAVARSSARGDEPGSA